MEEAWYELMYCFEDMCMFWEHMSQKYTHKVENVILFLKWEIIVTDKTKILKLNQGHSAFHEVQNNLLLLKSFSFILSFFCNLGRFS